MTMPIRVLIVDDSAFARKVLREVLSASSDVEVVGIARDGLEALEKIAELKPDVITLDLVMPNLDGIGVLQNLQGPGAPRVVLVSISDAASELAAQALTSGAVALVRKPTALATDQLYELRDELVQKVKEAAQARFRAPAQRTPGAALPSLVRAARVPLASRIAVLGTSTGGPQALTRLLPLLPGDFPVPIAMALHIPAGYTDALARRLNENSAIDVTEAEDGMPLRPGLAVLARGGMHLMIERRGSTLVARVSNEARGTAHLPSVDVLFQSAVDACGGAVLGVVMTGMGDDGLKGSRAIRAAGGRVLTESEDSCVIYGMPRCVVEAGYSTAEAPIEGLAQSMLEHL